MISKATLKYIRISPLKARKIVNIVKNKPADVALNNLKFMPNKSAKLLSGVIKSAIANAVVKKPEIDADQLILQNVIINQGPVLKRFRAKARGRGTRILKRTSHISVYLTELNTKKSRRQ